MTCAQKKYVCIDHRNGYEAEFLADNDYEAKIIAYRQHKGPQGSFSLFRVRGTLTDENNRRHLKGIKI